MCKCKLQFLTILLFFLFIFLAPAVFAHSQTQVIEITADGFIPSEVTVDTNSTIFFLNKDKESHWPASNPHPVHDLYPEFDPQLPIESGKSWTFKPKKIGEWRYHDHLDPHKGGIIRVTGESGSQNISTDWIQKLKKELADFLAKLTSKFIPKQKLDPLKFTKSSPTEQITQLKKFADSNGVEETWQFIKETYKSQTGSSGNIHDLAHLAGGLLFEKLDFKGITKCSPEFAFGCFHGFLDKAFAKNLDHLLDAQDACLKLAPDGSGPAASCIHGIGHGVASFYSVSDLNKALSACRKLIFGSKYCFDGVFMEFVRSAPESFYKKDDPLYPCDKLEEKFGYAYSLACGRNQPPLLMGRFKMGFEEVVSICLNSESPPFKQACFDSLGFSLASTGDPDQIIRGCQTIGAEEYVVACEKAAAGELIFQDIPNWQQKAPQICQTLSEKFSAECFQYLDQLIKQYNRK